MSAASWWQSRDLQRRFVTDLLEDELVRQRRAPVGRPRPWSDDLAFDKDLGVDSLELLGLASALAESLHLHESGIEDHLLVNRRLGGWLDVAGAGLERYNAQLTFRTSGSSGAPKPCVHPLDGLLQEVAHHASVFRGRRRVLSSVPSHHIYGFLFNLLLPHALGLPADEFVDLRASSPAWLARGALPGDLVVGHPDYWQAVARAVPTLAPDVVGVTSTAPCADAVSAAVEAAGLAKLVHVYGSSEAAGIGWRESWRNPYRLLPHWNFAAPDDDRLLRTWPDGSTAELAGQDRLTRLGPDLFQIAGRNDEAVQVGGINVFPSRVAAVLQQHPAVAAASVRLMRPEEGTRLKTFVVPANQGGDELLRDLNAWIEAQLSAPERPRAIRVGERLPVSPAGKACDWPI